MRGRLLETYQMSSALKFTAYLWSTVFSIRIMKANKAFRGQVRILFLRLPRRRIFLCTFPPSCYQRKSIGRNSVFQDLTASLMSWSGSISFSCHESRQRWGICLGCASRFSTLSPKYALQHRLHASDCPCGPAWSPFLTLSASWCRRTPLCLHCPASIQGFSSIISAEISDRPVSWTGDAESEM
jgi:hypothetical protein